MIRVNNYLRNHYLRNRSLFGVLCRYYGNAFKSNHTDMNEEVMAALHQGKPVVALESTIITHGMPFPENISCCTEVEKVIRKQGAVPATIAILKGRIKVGLDRNDLSQLGDVKMSVPIKTSRRDLSYVVSSKLNGGTTVSGTLIVASQIGIPVFATGGIGGVHREGETTFDISADLIELGKSSVAVISSGIKSILDIPKTLEYLETQGVFVATFGDNNDFPAFYCRNSGCQAPYNVTNALDAAKIIKTNKELNTRSGMLFAVPVPSEYALEEKHLNIVIDEALESARRNGVTGKQITPYLLSRVAKITDGKSLETNIALVKNNAMIAADIAVKLSLIENNKIDYCLSSNGLCKSTVNRTDRITNEPVIIGGSVMDSCARLTEKEIKLDGRIHNGTFTRSAGGVARNICEALGKLGCRPAFLSAVGDDVYGRYLRSLLPEESSKCVRILPQHATAQCTVILDGNGECKFLIGDMNIHEEITPEMVLENESLIKNSPLLILDANLNVSTITTALQIAHNNNIPVLFEPTDIPVSTKPFVTNYWKAIKIITPNLMELKNIARIFNIHETQEADPITQANKLAKSVANFVDVVIVTLGSSGLLVARRGLVTDPLLVNHMNEVFTRHYMVKQIDNLVNVSGAGDCFVAGFVSAMLKGSSEKQCISVGLKAAYESLKCSSAVPSKLFSYVPEVWEETASYNIL